MGYSVLRSVSQLVIRLFGRLSVWSVSWSFVQSVDHTVYFYNTDTSLLQILSHSVPLVLVQVRDRVMYEYNISNQICMLACLVTPILFLKPPTLLVGNRKEQGHWEEDQFEIQVELVFNLVFIVISEGHYEKMFGC